MHFHSVVKGKQEEKPEPLPALLNHEASAGKLSTGNNIMILGKPSSNAFHQD